jgi:hypothetical protein
LFSGSHWLPARRIDLSQQISDADGLRVGEPVTRTVILDAVGLDEHMLEEPQWPEIVNARIYPDQPQGISRDNGEWVLGHREFRYAVVPEQPGELVLPEIRLQWWDTVADRERVAVLPEHRVQVLPSEQALAASAPPLAPAGVLLPGDSLARGSLLRWQILSAVLAVLWLATLLLWLRGQGRARTAPETASGRLAAEAETLRALKAASGAGNAGEARRQLGSWLRHYGPGEARGTLNGLVRLADPELAAALRGLDAVGFKVGVDGDWNGDSLWRCFENWRRAGRNGQTTGPQKEEFNLYAAAKAGRG